MHIEWIKLFICDTNKCTFDISQRMTCNAETCRNNVFISKAHLLVSRMNKLIQHRFHFFIIFVSYRIRRLQLWLHNSTKESCIFPASALIIQSFSYSFDVHKSVHHLTIQLIQPTRCNSFTSLLPDVYVLLNMFRASPRPSSGAYNCIRSIWFYHWREAAATLLVVVPRPRPTMLQPLFSNGKTRGS